MPDRRSHTRKKLDYDTGEFSYAVWSGQFLFAGCHTVELGEQDPQAMMAHYEVIDFPHEQWPVSVDEVAGGSGLGRTDEGIKIVPISKEESRRAGGLLKGFEGHIRYKTRRGGDDATIPT